MLYTERKGIMPSKNPFAQVRYPYVLTTNPTAIVYRKWLVKLADGYYFTGGKGHTFSIAHPGTNSSGRIKIAHDVLLRVDGKVLIDTAKKPYITKVSGFSISPLNK
jgi:hypothetical protein